MINRAVIIFHPDDRELCEWIGSQRKIDSCGDPTCTKEHPRESYGSVAKRLLLERMKQTGGQMGRQADEPVE